MGDREEVQLNIVIVTGAREREPYAQIVAELKHRDNGLLMVIHGDCRGVDVTAGRACKDLGIQQVRVPANWGGEGRAAGPIRNRLMVEMALKLTHFSQVEVLAWPAPDSTGTRHMIRICQDEGLKVVVFERDA